MNRDPDLSGVHLKLARARTHIEALRSEVAAFVEQEPAPFGILSRQRPGPGGVEEHILYAQVRLPAPSTLALVIGDGVQNLRAALDHLIYALTPENVQSNQTAFPIVRDQTNWEEQRQRRINGLDEEPAALIERLQPFQSPAPDEHPLAVLGDLSNRDKHRLLVPVVAATDTLRTWIASENADITGFTFHLGPVGPDRPIASFTASPKVRTKNMTVDARAALRLEIADVALKDLAAVELLEVLHHYVEHSVIRLWTDPHYRRWRVAQLPAR